jgi:hypothetical protein
MALATQKPQVASKPEQYLALQNQQLATELEIDSTEDADFGTLYRLWKNSHFVGSFYQALNGKWVAQTSCGQVNGKFDTEEQVILALAIFTPGVTAIATGNLNTSIDNLLDKPFDELTVAEWQHLKTITPSECLKATAS